MSISTKGLAVGIVIGLLIGLVLGYTLTGTSGLQSRIDELKGEVTNLETQIDDLQSQLSEKGSQISNLQSQIDRSKESHISNLQQISTLLSQIEIKNIQITSLQAEVSQKESEIAYLQSIMPKGLDEHYEKIRWLEFSEFKNKRDRGGWLVCYVAQVLHDFGNYSFDYCITLRKYGEYCTHLTADFAIDFLGYISNVLPNASNMSRLQQVYNWVNRFVSYENGITRFPIETLIFRCGDCEDQAIALPFLLESCGYETALCEIHDKNLTKYGPEGLYHAFCVVRKNNSEYNGTLIQLNKYPEYGYDWIVLDPVFSHRFGGDPEWIYNYRMKNGTVYIPQAVWDCLLVDYDELVNRAEEIEMTLNT